MLHKMFRQLIYSTLFLILNGQISLHPQHKNQLSTYPTHPYIAITTDQLSRLPAAYQVMDLKIRLSPTISEQPTSM